MVSKIANWKQKTKNGYGLICENRDEYEYIYDRWLRSERCEECNKEYTEDNWKCMDHCHLTGLFRDIICNSCNSKRTTTENSSGTTNIHKKLNGWCYQIQINKKTHCKYSKDLEWLKNYKIEFEKKYLYNI
jgi:hypothetical protein